METKESKASGGDTLSKTEAVGGKASENENIREENEIEEPKFLLNLSILPPLQKGEAYPKLTTENDIIKNTLKKKSDGLVHLPPIRAEEPVASLRAALSEVRGYAHITHYRLVLDQNNLNAALHTPLPVDDVEADFDDLINSSVVGDTNDNATKKKKKNKSNQKTEPGKESFPKSNVVSTEDVMSPYTGPNAMIMAPDKVKVFSEMKNLSDAQQSSYKFDECVLDDYGDLTPLLIDNLLEDGSAFRMMLTRYDSAGIRDHVARLRALLDGNAPFAITLEEPNSQTHDNDDKNKEDQQTVSKQESSTELKDSQNTSESINENATDAKEKEEADILQENKIPEKKSLDDARAKQLKEMAEKMPLFPLDKQIAIDGKNIKDYYSLSCGEEKILEHENSDKKGEKMSGSNMDTLINAKLIDLDEQTCVNCMIRYSGFNPPPTHRRLLGDLAYLEISTPGSNEATIHVTATPLGFYVNRSSVKDCNSYNFNPTPAVNACFSHELLDCLLQRSKSFRSSWATALEASKKRANIMTSLSAKDSTIKSLHRIAIRSNLNFMPHQNIDSLILKPSWLIQQREGNFYSGHAYNINRAEDDLASSHGIDIRGGSLRDWNEELQSAREMPTDSLHDRIERARLINKVLTDFGEAALVGVLAIFDGHVAPMNPNDSFRSQVYLHNNIFFSKALDAGVDTFKVAQGDNAARKSASRDAQCVGALHRLDKSNLHTLATVLIDYYGTRFVCQSLVPGILHGEKTHTLLYGAVEAASPLSWDKDMHDLLESIIGKGLLIGSSKVPTQPLNEERLTTINDMKESGVMVATKNDLNEEKESIEPTTLLCGPLEAKGIRGSDHRNYFLDLTRFTPRDANWVSKADGGTGNWEETWSEESKKAQKQIPKSVKDDEWTMAVLRPELITHLTHKEMTEYMKKKTIRAKLEKEIKSKKEDSVDVTKKASNANDREDQSNGANEKLEESQALNDVIKAEDVKYLDSLRYNLNVFLPNTKSLAEIDPVAFIEHKKDEERTRAAANHLWNFVLPSVTKEMRENSPISAHQLPVDGISLTELLHTRGINCRYLGRLAHLAEMEEQNDRQAEVDIVTGKAGILPRKSMPLCWLELLECEMVARAAKHVLDNYFMEAGAAVSIMPSEMIATFLSALMSTSEESAGETEIRMSKQRKNDENMITEEELSTTTMSYHGGGDSLPLQTRGRKEIWEDIEVEVGRRFRYSLVLYNSKGNAKEDKKSSRCLFLPLLRRICQRAGVRIAAKNYDLGGKCLCSSSSTPGHMSSSYPISPIDIIEIVPMVKHAAAHGGEGFVPYSVGPTIGSTSLHILLPDAKTAFEAAHVHWNARSLPRALDLTQEATNLYQRVTETPLHASVARCFDLTAVILFQAQEPELAASNGARALGVAVQLGGFDCAEAVTAHTTLSHILSNSGDLAGGFKHIRTAIYLMELMGGHHHAELANMYHKLGTMYHEIGNGIHALRFYEEAAKRQISDRMISGMISKSSALVLGALGQYKSALESERKAYGIYKLILGNKHDLTVTSANNLKNLMELAVEQGTRFIAEEKMRLETEAADAIATKIEAEEAEEEKKKKKKKKKSKKKS